MTSRSLTVPGQLSFDDVTASTAEPVDPGTRPVDPGTSEEARHGSPAAPFAVDVVRSPRRTKTAEARLLGSTLEIRIPARCSRDEERALVEHFTAKFQRSRSAEAIDLELRAAALAAELGLPTPASIRWVSNQKHRWGSCTPTDGTIRLSDRLAEFPQWVIDYVIVHELAHLVVTGHDAAFWALVEPYALGERARGFLIAKGLDGH